MQLVADHKPPLTDLSDAAAIVRILEACVNQRGRTALGHA